MKVSPSRTEMREPAATQKATAAMIEIDGVSQVFQTSARQDHLALSDISLTVEDGAFVSILGPSGCGKSTLLYIVGGFVQPTKGAARMKGRVITGPGPDRGPVFQEFALFPWKTVRLFPSSARRVAESRHCSTSSAASCSRPAVSPG